MELSRSRAENARLKREADILSDGVPRAGCAVKYAWIAAQRNGLALNALCDVRRVSVSSDRA